MGLPDRGELSLWYQGEVRRSYSMALHIKFCAHNSAAALQPDLKYSAVSLFEFALLLWAAQS